MFIPTWLLVIVALAGYYAYKAWSDKQKENTPEFHEKMAEYFKGRLLEISHFDSPRIIDLQDQCEVMEANYYRIKQRFAHDEQKTLELAKDWSRYVEALGEMKFAREMLNVDMSDSAYENFSDSTKEPYIITDEINKKFKVILGKDFEKFLPDYDERKKKAGKKADFMFTNWKDFYYDSPNYQRLREYREKEKKEDKS